MLGLSVFDLSAFLGKAGDGDEPTAFAVGWREWVAMPELCLPLIKAKIDTGARSSALSVSSLKRQGDRLTFTVNPLRKHSATVNASGLMIDERIVRDSGGHEELRPVMRTALQMGDAVREIELTLTDRKGMLFPLLIGRTALTGLAVRPDLSYLTRKRPSQDERERAYSPRVQPTGNAP